MESQRLNALRMLELTESGSSEGIVRRWCSAPTRFFVNEDGDDNDTKLELRRKMLVVEKLEHCKFADSIT